jgi:transposase InsO family protein
VVEPAWQMAVQFKDLLALNEALQRMSRRGNCCDNTHTESFWSRFKAELLDGGSFPGLDEAKLKISQYIACYNAEQRHSALGHLTPSQ